MTDAEYTAHALAMLKIGEEDFYDEAETGEILNKTVASLRSDASRRKGPPRIVIGKRVLYRQKSLVAYLLAHEVDPEAARQRFQSTGASLNAAPTSPSEPT